MKPEEKLLIKARSHKDGHLFEVSETAVEWIEQYQHFKGVTKSIVELLNLISLRGFSSKDGTFPPLRLSNQQMVKSLALPYSKG